MLSIAYMATFSDLFAYFPLGFVVNILFVLADLCTVFDRV
jgi:hypothetical protein